jgi:hypothetical protein
MACLSRPHDSLGSHGPPHDSLGSHGRPHDSLGSHLRYCTSMLELGST